MFHTACIATAPGQQQLEHCLVDPQSEHRNIDTQSAGQCWHWWDDRHTVVYSEKEDTHHSAWAEAGETDGRD